MRTDEDGYIEVIATLTTDSSVQETSWIPIEALRTRGLSSLDRRPFLH